MITKQLDILNHPKLYQANEKNKGIVQAEMDIKKCLKDVKLNNIEFMKTNRRLIKIAEKCRGSN